MTDRLAEFVRRFLVRANDVHISPKNLDHFLRRLVQPHAGAYSENARTVLAGIERLFFISPFESWALIQAVHNENTGEAAQLLRRYSAYFFERYGVGMELLGAEPLRLLIAEHVLKGLASPYDEDPWSTPFDYFLRHEKFLLATSTNATKGELHVFGQEAADGKSCKALLVEALLASSAFPAVFRPRRFAEVYPCDADDSVETETKFIDGGLMDNLPLDHVVTFLHKRAQQGLLARRPCGGKVPHLLLTASLEPKAAAMDPDLHPRTFREDWRLVTRRVKELSYNRKIEMFADAQDDFRQIAAAQKQGNLQWSPLDIKFMTVVPKWLCGTFGFHATLGFRRYKQAASIAHGCPMTFVTLSRLKNEPFGDAYGIQAERCVYRFRHLGFGSQLRAGRSSDYPRFSTQEQADSSYSVPRRLRLARQFSADLRVLTLDDFDFDLPGELIAQHPTAERTASRLLQLSDGIIHDRRFSELPEIVEAGDLLVFNDTRVFRARLFGRKESGGQIEVLIERIVDARHAVAQIRASKAPQAEQPHLSRKCHSAERTRSLR